MRSALAEILAVVAPPACAACRAPLGPAGRLVCADCLRALPWLSGPRCGRCALPDHGHRGCPAAGAAFERAWAPLAYAGPARDLVVALKLRGALPVTGLMAAQLAANTPAELLAGAVLVPVPPHPGRRRARGFDSVERLAAGLAGRTGLPVAARLSRGGGGKQAGAGRAERRRSGRLDVRCAGPAPAVAALLDDVHTTGATLDACARALRAAGARRVVALTYARTL